MSDIKTLARLLADVPTNVAAEVAGLLPSFVDDIKQKDAEPKRARNPRFVRMCEKLLSTQEAKEKFDDNERRQFLDALEKEKIPLSIEDLAVEAAKQIDADTKGDAETRTRVSDACIFTVLSAALQVSKSEYRANNMSPVAAIYSEMAHKSIKDEKFASFASGLGILPDFEDVKAMLDRDARAKGEALKASRQGLLEPSRPALEPSSQRPEIEVLNAALGAPPCGWRLGRDGLSPSRRKKVKKTTTTQRDPRQFAPSEEDLRRGRRQTRERQPSPVLGPGPASEPPSPQAKPARRGARSPSRLKRQDDAPVVDVVKDLEVSSRTKSWINKIFTLLNSINNGGVDQLRSAIVDAIGKDPFVVFADAFYFDVGYRFDGFRKIKRSFSPGFEGKFTQLLTVYAEATGSKEADFKTFFAGISEDIHDLVQQENNFDLSLSDVESTTARFLYTALANAVRYKEGMDLYGLSSTLNMAFQGNTEFREIRDWVTALAERETDRSSSVKKFAAEEIKAGVALSMSDPRDILYELCLRVSYRDSSSEVYLNATNVAKRLIDIAVGDRLYYSAGLLSKAAQALQFFRDTDIDRASSGTGRRLSYVLLYMMLFLGTTYGIFSVLNAAFGSWGSSLVVDEEDASEDSDVTSVLFTQPEDQTIESDTEIIIKRAEINGVFATLSLTMENLSDTAKVVLQEASNVEQTVLQMPYNLMAIIHVLASPSLSVFRAISEWLMLKIVDPDNYSQDIDVSPEARDRLRSIGRDMVDLSRDRKKNDVSVALFWVYGISLAASLISAVSNGFSAIGSLTNPVIMLMTFIFASLPLIDMQAGNLFGATGTGVTSRFVLSLFSKGVSFAKNHKLI